MRQTVGYIPHEIAGISVFGFGWLLGAWVIVSAIVLVVSLRRHGWHGETRGSLFTLIIVGLAIVYVLPRLEESATGQTWGVPIRGYGVMLLAAVIAGVALAVHRARRVGFDPDIILALAFWMFVGGICGARLFFVIQYWHEFQRASLLSTIGAVINVAQGGLVVYGSLVGALIAGGWFVHRRALPVLVVGDLIAPSLLLGLAIGRIGCLLNGCCYGGICSHPWAIAFPRAASPYTENESPPYAHQHRWGILHGFRLDGDPAQRPVVGQLLDRHGPGAQSSLKVGDRIKSINGYPVETVIAAQSVMAAAGPQLVLETVGGNIHRWSIGQLPEKSRPIHPTQIYSSINAALICLLLLAYDPFRRRPGELIALTLTLYPVTRFLLELIRTDEGVFSGTGLTISQNVSLLMLPLALALWVYVLRQPRERSW